jgi:dTDP-4-amino-4,6-dideoxygalactose transaminase
VDHGRSEATVPLADPRGDMADLRDKILQAVTTTIDSGSYILGSEVAAFERAIAARLGTPGAVGVGSGTDALALALLAVGVKPCDEVITVSHTAGATAAAIRMVGAVPVLVDIESDTFSLDAGAIEAAIGPRTRAILPVHLYGHPADLKAIGAVAGRHGVSIVEDCAQAQDAAIDDRPVGTFGNIGCFSFYPTKTLGALGDGGLIASTKGELVDRARLLRVYGWRRPQFSEIPGGRCSRLDELQASILRVKLDRLTKDVESRRAMASRYNEELAGLPIILPTEQPGCRHVYHLYVIRCDRRDELAQHLERVGVATGIHYEYPVHMQPGLAEGCRIAGSLQTTEAVVRDILSLPIYPSLTKQSQDRVIAGVRAFFGR